MQTTVNKIIKKIVQDKLASWTSVTTKFTNLTKNEVKKAKRKKIRNKTNTSNFWISRKGGNQAVCKLYELWKQTTTMQSACCVSNYASGSSGIKRRERKRKERKKREKIVQWRKSQASSHQQPKRKKNPSPTKRILHKHIDTPLIANKKELFGLHLSTPSKQRTNRKWHKIILEVSPRLR